MNIFEMTPEEISNEITDSVYAHPKAQNAHLPYVEATDIHNNVGQVDAIPLGWHGNVHRIVVVL